MTENTDKLLLLTKQQTMMLRRTPHYLENQESSCGELRR